MKAEKVDTKQIHTVTLLLSDEEVAKLKSFTNGDTTQQDLAMGLVMSILHAVSPPPKPPVKRSRETEPPFSVKGTQFNDPDGRTVPMV